MPRPTQNAYDVATLPEPDSPDSPASDDTSLASYGGMTLPENSPNGAADTDSTSGSCATNALWSARAGFVSLTSVVTGSEQPVGEKFLEEERLNNEGRTQNDHSFAWCCGPCFFKRNSHRRFSILFGPVVAAPFSTIHTLAISIARVACFQSQLGRSNYYSQPSDLQSRSFQWTADVVTLLISFTVLGLSSLVIHSLGPLLIFAVAHSACVAAWLHEGTMLPVSLLSSGPGGPARADLLISCFCAAPSAVLMSNIVGSLLMAVFLYLFFGSAEENLMSYNFLLAALLPWLSSLLISYLANEIRIFVVQELHLPKSYRKGKRYGVDGIRTMHPIVCTATATTTALSILACISYAKVWPGYYLYSTLVIVCSLWPLFWSACVVFTVVDLAAHSQLTMSRTNVVQMNTTDAPSHISCYKFCERAMSWLISWQGLAAMNLSSMVSSLIFGVYVFMLLDEMPDHVDCVATYTCPQAYDPCAVPTDVFNVSWHNTSFTCNRNSGFCGKLLRTKRKYEIESDGCRGSLCSSKPPELHCDIFEKSNPKTIYCRAQTKSNTTCGTVSSNPIPIWTQLNDVLKQTYSSLAPAHALKFFFPDGSSECNPTVTHSKAGEYVFQPPSSQVCAYYSPDCCDQTPEDWSSTEGQWLGTNGTAPYMIDNSPSTLKTLLIVWMTTASFGVIVCSCTVLGRYWPKFKFFPTDDSFRVTVMLKLLLLALKAGVQSMTGHDRTADEAEQLLSLLSYISFLISLALTALVTIAFQIFKAWRYVDVLARIHRPKKFLLCYVVNYVSAKMIAIHVLLIALRVGDNRCSEEAQNLVMFMLSVYGPSLLLLMYNNNECAKFIDGSVRRYLQAERLLQPSTSSSPAMLGLSTSPDGVKAIVALSVVGQLVGFGFAIFQAVRSSPYRYAPDGALLSLFSQTTTITAIAVTTITSLSGLFMAWAV